MRNKIKRGNESLKVFWNWLWNSDSWFSYIVFLILVFIIVKFIFLPGLGLIMNTTLPLAIVESSSMEHYSLKYCKSVDSNGQCLTISSEYALCDQQFNSQKFYNKDEYWKACGNWYEQNTNVTKEEFQSFSFKNGFRKGDLMIIYGKKNIKVGDVIIFEAGRNHPIIHRVISLNPIQTKGDHNSGQLPVENSIQQDQILGTAIAKIPYVGWIKLFFVDLLNGFK